MIRALTRTIPPDLLSRAMLGVLICLVIAGVFGPVLPMGSSSAIVGPRLAPPSADWPLGTDELGRSLLPRLLEGIGTTFLLTAMAVCVTIAAAVLLGMVAGYFGGLLGELLARTIDILFAFPTVILALLVAAVFGGGTPAAITSIVLVTLPTVFRVVRAATMTWANRDFVTVAKVTGASHGRVLFVHVLPNLSNAVIIQAAYAISLGFIVESVLSFLGLGVQPPDASLGSLVRQGSVYLVAAPWLVFAPGLVLVAAVLSLNLLADSWRDLREPRVMGALR